MENLNGDWIGVLIQVPLLAVFIWYSLKLQERFDVSLTKRDELYEQRNTALVGAISELTHQIACMTDETREHNAKTEAAMHVQRRSSRT